MWLTMTARPALAGVKQKEGALENKITKVTKTLAPNLSRRVTKYRVYHLNHNGHLQSDQDYWEAQLINHV